MTVDWNNVASAEDAWDFCEICEVFGCVCEYCETCNRNVNPYTHTCE
jgi:hypothetical protein